MVFWSLVSLLILVLLNHAHAEGSEPPVPSVSTVPSVRSASSDLSEYSEPSDFSLNLLEKIQGLRDSTSRVDDEVRDRIAQRRGLAQPIGALARFVEDAVQVQATLIFLSVLSLQASNERSVVGNGNNGNNNSGSGELQVANAGLCQPNAGPVQKVLCSGEFYTGVLSQMLLNLAGIGVSKVSKVAKGNQIVMYLLGNAATRIPLVRFILTMASTSSSIGGSQGAVFLWSDAVKLLPENDRLRADGIVGRAILALGSGQAKAFWRSVDGRIFLAILVEIYKIAWTDEALRSRWLYNTWRFGIARGEFVTSVAVLMPIGRATAFTAKFGQMTHAIWFAILSGFGIWTLDKALSSTLPNKITNLFQASREFVNEGLANQFRTDVKILAEGFRANRYPAADEPTYVVTYENQLIKWLFA